MTSTGSAVMLMWLALGAAVALVPGATPASVRAGELAGLGRLRNTVGGMRSPAAPPVARGVLAATACVLAGLAAGSAGGAVLGLAAVIATATGARLVLGALSRRAAARAQEQMLGALRLLVAELEAGATPAVAFGAAADLLDAAGAGFPVGGAARSVGGSAGGRAAAGAGHLALREAARRCAAGDDPELEGGPLDPLAHAWRLAVLAGSPLAGVCARVADDFAARIEQRRAVGAALAAARSSAALLAGLPVLGLALGTAMQAHPVAILLTTPSGRLVCLVGVTLDAAGLLWTQWLTARAERS